VLASGKLGQHNGLPACIIVTTTLAEPAERRAHHYPAILDHGKALALYHTKRLASPANESCSTPKTVLVMH
jgi:hypothetical protein